MDSLMNFFRNFDVTALIFLLISAVASVLCITVHELCHGLAARALGDDTASKAGRLTLNPLAHIDPIGFLMMIFAHVGWAKPVPVDVRNFRKPKRDMALTALAGPCSNFLLAFIFLGAGSIVLRVGTGIVSTYLLVFFTYIAMLSVGLGVFNLIPLPPLDGSKLLCSFLPDRIYRGYLRYERYFMLVVIALAWLGVFSGVLDVGMGWVLRGMCRVTAFPFEFLHIVFGL